jgi:hypothetical protein
MLPADPKATMEGIEMIRPSPLQKLWETQPVVIIAWP